MNTTYPLTAIVGQVRMKRALILNAINPQIGGVLIRGERGTAKSTAARALAALLPAIEVVADCIFNCNPFVPSQFCDQCRQYIGSSSIPTITKPTPFVDLPVSATEDRVVGTLDIEKAIQEGRKHFEPGVLAAANRGVLYVDEVNLLDDHVVDLLLDSAAMGFNTVEREGISVQHPARFVLVGSMNPEEGDLRPQLLDRFAHAVDVTGIIEAGARVKILQRRLDYDMQPEQFVKKWIGQERDLGDRVSHAALHYEKVEYTKRDLYTIAALTTNFGVDGHRADIVILKTARAQAGLDGRSRITSEDILMAAELALPHRMKKQPFQEVFLNPDQLEKTLQQAEEEAQQMVDDEDLATEEAEGTSASDEKKVRRAMTLS